MSADYSQIEFYAGEGGSVDTGDLGIVNQVDDDYAILTVARQNGRVRAIITVHDEPPPIDPAWDCVAELPWRSGIHPRVCGWGREGEDLPIPVPAGADLRARYVVLDGDAGSKQHASPDRYDEEPLEHYLLQIWPAAAEPSVVAVSTAAWSQYWTFGPEAEAAVAQLDSVPDPQRLVRVIDAALEAHPDVVTKLLAGDDRYRVGVIRYAQELFRLTYASDAYSEIQHDYDELNRLIDDRVAARRP